MKSKNTFSWFRKTAFIEGISYLVLLLVAMPLKYFAGKPLAVTIIGGLHGFLFVAFIILAILSMIIYKRSWLWFIKSFIASLLPFGTFWMDNTHWKKEELAVAKQFTYRK